MRPLLIGIGLLTLAVPVSAQSNNPPDRAMRVGYVALAAVSFADIETTGRCLEIPGCRERNPLLAPFGGTPGAVGLVNGALSGAVGLGAYKLHKRGKRTEARILIWTWTVIRAGVVVHNIRQLRK